MNDLSPIARANDAQRQASDPAASAFVSASAGSGKTKLLTDRLLRLMLSGAEPGRIQCLTFTKAAAAEMAMRLQRRLGKWVTLDDAALNAELAEIGMSASPDLRDLARQLFARVLDLPGGMRIGTIHAFCQSLLRRFPLEAKLSPHFTLADDRDTALAWQEARESMLAHAYHHQQDGELNTLAGWASLEKFSGLVQGLQRASAEMETLAHLSPEALLNALRQALGAREFDAEIAATGIDERMLHSGLVTVAQQGSPAVAQRAQMMVDWLAQPAVGRARHWSLWYDEFFGKNGDARKFSSFPNAKIRPLVPELEEVLLAEQTRIANLLDGQKAAHLARISAALILLARPVLASYAEGKSRTGRLDYDDLIARTEKLLEDPGAAWVLFKLDGGLDHLLLDEVQDTSPAQWAIAGQLTSEFFVGEGAHSDRPRSVFAVGDRKQSIYGFQGADPEAFEDWRKILGNSVRNGGQEWRDVPLDVSFRSTAPVLKLVDEVFNDPDTAAGVAEPPGTLAHVVNRVGHAGRVELWPLVPMPVAAEPDLWDAPHENRGQRQARQTLADTLARTIARWLDEGRRLESQDRLLTAGDILVLVRKRDAFCGAFVNALKAHGVKVAGLDRMVLTDEPAVQDMLALCDALLLPRDDLALACVLTSPLGGFNDDALMRLAMPTRTGSLWGALQASTAPEAQAATAFLRQLFARVDHVPPHALLAEALGPLGGRARLLARFGHEAAEPLDELLAASLRYALSHPPSLQGFVQWLRQTASSVKREPEGASGETLDAVRIMTVHGAKGLQAPLVILPDTTGKPPADDKLVWLDSDGLRLPIWAPNKALRCRAIEAQRGDTAEEQAEEQNRLLYVALTRAEDWLLVCGWETKTTAPQCWYNQVRRGFDRLPDAVTETIDIRDGFPGEIRVWQTAQTAAPRRQTSKAATEYAALPEWAGAAPLWQPTPPPIEPALPQPLAPSRPEGASLGEVPAADSPLQGRDTAGQRFRRGQVVHTLLQHLPELPPAQWEAAALNHIRRTLPDLAHPDVQTAELLAVLRHPELGALFGPGSRAEVPISGVLGNQVIGGLIDRLVIAPGRVLVADYKTNRNPPKSVERTPILYLRQMAAYRALLRKIFPESEISCVLIWTVGARAMMLPPSLLDGHAPGAAIAA